MATSSKRLVLESPVNQAPDEEIAYQVDFSRWGTPSNPVVTLYDGDGTDVSTDHLSGSATVDGDTVITPQVVDLEDGKNYSLVVQAVFSSNVKSAVCSIVCEFP